MCCLFLLPTLRSVPMVGLDMGMGELYDVRGHESIININIIVMDLVPMQAVVRLRVRQSTQRFGRPPTCGVVLSLAQPLIR